MHRLFVAIDLPFWVKDQLVAVMGGIIGARWQRDDQLHLTLRFIGNVDTHTANAAAEALGTIRHPAFEISGRGVDVFDRKGRPESLWVGVEPQEALRALHNKVDRALLRVGIAPDTRSYLPHITLARFSREVGPLDAFLTAAGGTLFPPFTVDSFCLYESRLTGDGADYEVVERYRFAAGTAPTVEASHPA